MTGTRWTPTEDAVLRDTYPDGGLTATRRALAAVGYERTEDGIQNRAFRLRVSRNRETIEAVVPFIPIDPVDGVYHAPGRYPASVGRDLWRLAESNPTPEVYEREKTRILEGSRA